MRSALNSPAPSSALLKFLRSQSEGVCFFSPNPRPGFTFDHAAPRTPVVQCLSKAPARRLSTTIPRRDVLEAGFLNLDFLWPRAASATSVIPSRPARALQSKKASAEKSLGDYRYASTRTKWWRSRLWGISSKPQPLQAHDLPSLEEDDGSAFSLGHRISAKAAAQPKLRCTELDENGVVVLASGEFKKSELIAKVSKCIMISLRVCLC